MPPQTKVPFAITALKVKAEQLDIRKIEAGPTGGRILFHPNPLIDPIKVIQLIQTQPKGYKPDGPDKLRLTTAFDRPEAKIAFVEKLVGELAG